MEQLLEWKKVEPPAKGFGKNMENKVPQMPGGKVNKGPEEKHMGLIVTEEEIRQTVAKFKLLKDNNPHLIGEVEDRILVNIADYLADRRRGDPEPETWEVIKRGNIYSYACYIHEKTELELLGVYEDRKYYHGGALCEQYLFIQNYLKLQTGEEFDIIRLCYSDSWKEGERDKKNSRIFKKYLKEERPDLYKPLKHRETVWNKGTEKIAEIMNKMRNGEFG